MNWTHDSFADTATTGYDTEVSGAKAVTNEFVGGGDSMIAGV